jgi:hypothetical protein
MKPRFLMPVFLAATLAAIAVLAGEPSTLIDAPDQVAPYKLVDAKINGDWESAIWELAPEGKADLRIAADGKSLIFVAPPGDYTLRAVVVNFTAKKLAQGKRAITIGDPKPPTPPEPPEPPLPPSPAAAAKQLAIDAAKKLPQGAELVADAAKLAQIYAGLAKMIPAEIDSIDKLIVANRYAREAGLGPLRAQVWEPWVKELGVWLDAQRTAGAIKTVDDCKAVWTAIGEGLASVK